MHEYLIKLLEGMGVPGGIIFVLMSTVTVLATVIRRMQTRADKIYGYRLAERDTLNKAMTDTAKVLGDMLRATEERNDLTEEQADLISKQSAAFELLKVTLIAHHETSKDHYHTVAQAISAMAEAIRVLTAMVQDNRHFMASNLTAATKEIIDAVRAASQAQIIDVRNQLGAGTIVMRRRKSPL
jgi:phosphatidylserine/phosphatidylglycerophosphate/cardiolipin synthase-like enzyme